MRAMTLWDADGEPPAPHTRERIPVLVQERGNALKTCPHTPHKYCANTWEGAGCCPVRCYLEYKTQLFKKGKEDAAPSRREAAVRLLPLRDGELQKGRERNNHGNSAKKTSKSPAFVRLCCPCPARCLWPGTRSRHRWTGGRSPSLKGRPQPRGPEEANLELNRKGCLGRGRRQWRAGGRRRGAQSCHVTPWGHGESWQGAGGSGGPGPGGGHRRARAMVGARGAGPLSSGRHDAGHGSAQSCPSRSSPWIPGRSAGDVWGQRQGGNEDRGHGAPCLPARRGFPGPCHRSAGLSFPMGEHRKDSPCQG